MFRSYFKSAWRNLIGHKFYSVINISGLAVGLATGIILLLWVQDEMSYDKFNKDYHNIYEVSSHLQSGDKEVTWADAPGALAVFAKTFPQVKSLVRIRYNDNKILANANKTKVLSGFQTAYVDSSFFSIFNCELIRGTKAYPFQNNGSVLITQSTSTKLFGREDPMGKTIIYGGNEFVVSGVLKDFPENSSLQLDAIFPMAFYAKQYAAHGGNGSWKTIDEDLGNFYYDTYLKLQPGTDPDKIARDFTQAYAMANKSTDTRFQLENLANKHLIGPDGNDSALKMVQIFMLVAILLLVIAAINYVNLSTARSMMRLKEISVRKIIGAGKGQLFFQFIVETTLLFCVAIIVAFALVALLMPLYNRITGKDLHFALTSMQTWKITGYAIVGTLLATSIYPALLLSSFRPLPSLKRKDNSGIGTSLSRKMLVVFQFVISVVLIVATLVISHQMEFIRNKNLGYDKSYVFAVMLPKNAAKHADAIKNELSKQPSILETSASGISDISDIKASTSEIHWPNEPENNNTVFGQAPIDKDFIPTMKMQLLEGKNFSGGHGDSAHYIINATAVKAMGLSQPVIGQRIRFHQQEGTIVGVVKDFNFKSLSEKVAPFIFFSYSQWRWGRDMLYVRTTAKDAQTAIEAVKNQYNKYSDNVPFTYHFVDKQFADKYKTDQRAGILFNLFAFIAIFISCLGLLGLATFTAQKRTKEIGIRKVLGASVSGILTLIGMDFIKLVLIAIIIAIPIAYLTMNKWLQNFAYRINISWWIFLVAGLLAIVIAVITVSWQAIRAARANPVKSLRSE